MSEAVPQSRFRRFWTDRLITSVLVLVIVLLHAGVRLQSAGKQDAAYRNLGLLTVRHSAEHRELFGPFDLWEGQWWRIPLGALHHDGWWHLVLASTAAFYLGSLLESKISRGSYVGFLLGALLVTALPRWWGEESVPKWFMGQSPATGISGVVFAQYGALLLLRRNDRRLTRQFGEGAILLGIVVGLGSMAFSTIGLADGIDNLAHLAGLGYGLLWGLVLSAPTAAQRFLVPALVSAHLLIWPAVQGVVSPADNGRYHWWLAEQTDDPEQKKQHYRNAVAADSYSLITPRLALAELELESGHAADAWRTLLEGMSYHDEIEGAAELGRRVWAELSSRSQRRRAWDEAEQTLSARIEDWSGRLLSPRQASAFFLEEGEPLKAWAFLMRHLSTKHPPEGKADLSESGKHAESIWKRLDSPQDRFAALGILDRELGDRRRAWHLAIIPRRDLISHYQSVGEVLWAWQAVMKELRDDPAFRERGIRTAEGIWQMLPTELRRDRARKIVEDTFGPGHLDWQIELGILSDALKEKYRLDQSVQLPAEALDLAVPARILPFDPNAPDSASMGERL